MEGGGDLDVEIGFGGVGADVEGDLEEGVGCTVRGKGEREEGK